MTSHQHARHAIERILGDNPALWWGGWWTAWHSRTTDATLAERRAETLTERGVAQFLRAEAFIAQAPRTRGINLRRSTYGWKHDAERFHRKAVGDDYAHVYVGEGAFIAAAIDCGLIILLAAGCTYTNLSMRARVSAE